REVVGAVARVVVGVAEEGGRAGVVAHDGRAGRGRTVDRCEAAGVADAQGRVEAAGEGGGGSGGRLGRARVGVGRAGGAVDGRRGRCLGDREVVGAVARVVVGVAEEGGRAGVVAHDGRAGRGRTVDRCEAAGVADAQGRVEAAG